MSLEAATYISQLSQSNPTSSDPTQQGDDHIRLIKAALKATFPNASRAIFFREVVEEDDAATPTNADAGKTYPLTANSGDVSVNLPSSPTEGVEFEFIKTDFSRNIVTINGNGNNINGLTSIILFKPYQRLKVYYSSELSAWIAELDKVVETGTFLDNGDTALREAIIADGTKTLGNTSSGADYLGNKYRQLYEHLWTNYGDSVCPVNTGRGLSATADFLANKRIQMPALNGYIRVTQDNQGGLTASRVSAANAVGVRGGSATATLLRTHLPNVQLTLTTNETGAHTHTQSTTPGTVGDDGSQSGAVPGSPQTGSAGAHSHTGTTDYLSGGAASQTSFSIMNPYFTTKTHMAL